MKKIILFIIMIFLITNYESIAQEKKLKTAIISVIDETNYEENLSTIVTKSLNIELIKQGEFKIISPEIVDKILTDSKISPIDKYTLPQIIPLFEDVDAFILGKIYNLKLKKNPAQVDLRLTMELYNRNSELINKIDIPINYKKLGYKEPDIMIINEAINNLSNKAVQKLKFSFKIEGLIIHVEKEKYATINLGQKDGINNGAEFNVIDDNEIIANLKVVKVNDKRSEAEIVYKKEGYIVKPNQIVKLTYNPEVKPIPKRKRQLHKLENITKYILGGAAIYAMIKGKEKKAPPPEIAPVAKIELSANPSALLADGKSQSIITAKVIDAEGRAIKDGTEIRFKTDKGMISGDAKTIGGVATTTLTSDTTSGIATITAYYGDIKAQIQVPFSNIIVRITKIEPPSIPANGIATSTITVEVLDPTGKPVEDGTKVEFSTTDGIITNVTKTLKGIATSTLISSVSAEVVEAKITATVDVVSATTIVKFIPVEPATINLYSDKNNAPADGKSKITLTATVLDIDGNSVANGTPVNFDTTLGELSTNVAFTINGDATVTLSSSTPGDGIVRATCRNITTSIPLFFTQVAIELQASPGSIIADGNSQSQIIATIKNVTTGEVITNAKVLFITSMGSITPSGITDETGKAYAILTSSKKSGIAKVSAAYQYSSASISVIFAPYSVASISLEASPSTLPADGISQSIIIAIVKDIHGNPIEDNTPVWFKTSDPNSELTPVEAVTINGKVVTILRASTTPHLVTITCGYGPKEIPVLTATVNVIFTRAMAAYIRFAAEGNILNIRGWDKPGNTIPISVYVMDENGNPVPDGTIVNFSCDGGIVEATASTIKGKATINYTTIGRFPIGEAKIDWDKDGVDLDGDGSIYHKGWATLTAKYSGATDKLYILNSSRAKIIKLTTSENEVIAGTTRAATITAEVLDENYNPVTNGTPVNFSAKLGSIIPSTATTSDGINRSEAKVVYNAGTIVGEDTVTAEIDGVTASININILPAAASKIILEATPTSILADGQTQSIIKATIYDAYNNLVTDATEVRFNTTAGSLSVTKTTTTNGEAKVVLTSSTTATTATVSVTAGTVTNTIQVKFYPGEPVYISLTASPKEIPADEISTSTITAMVYDKNNNLVGDGYRIDFETTGGSIDSFAFTKDGKAVVTLKSSLEAGTVTVKAKYQTIIEAQTTVGFYTEPHIVLDTASVVISTTGSTVVTATVYDKYGEETPDIWVMFSVSPADYGGCSPTSEKTDGTGVAQTTFYGVGKEGIITITATATVSGKKVSKQTVINISSSPP